MNDLLLCHYFLDGILEERRSTTRGKVLCVCVFHSIDGGKRESSNEKKVKNIVEANSISRACCDTLAHGNESTKSIQHDDDNDINICNQYNQTTTILTTPTRQSKTSSQQHHHQRGGSSSLRDSENTTTTTNCVVASRRKPKEYVCVCV